MLHDVAEFLEIGLGKRKLTAVGVITSAVIRWYPLPRNDFSKKGEMANLLVGVGIWLGTLILEWNGLLDSEGGYWLSASSYVLSSLCLSFKTDF